MKVRSYEAVNNVKRSNSGNKTKDTSIRVFKQCQLLAILRV